ncbi:hypothetical protein ABZU25_16870 [Micromonospora sp. NPDC005215]|uniref:hypothetical protein n=1 Tax=Micromonospora sp. NPDC005215 TaxID=3157024 RepID=UPI0033A85D70
MRIETLVRIGIVAKMASEGWTLLGQDSETVRFTTGGSAIGDCDLHINIEVREARTWLNPIVGLYNAKTAELFTAFLGLPPSRTAVVGSTLADLLHQQGHHDAPVPRWSVRSEADIATILQALASDLAIYGVPYIRAFREVEDVAVELNRVGLNQLDSGRLAVLYAVDGRMERAVASLTHFGRAAQVQAGSVADQSKNFIRAFARHFGIEDQLPFVLQGG